MTKLNKFLLVCFISVVSFSCADGPSGEGPLTLASAGASGMKDSSAGSDSSGNGGSSGSSAGTAGKDIGVGGASSGNAGSSVAGGSSGKSGTSGNAGSSPGTAGASGSQNTGGNAGNPTQPFGGAAGNEVGGSSSGEDYSVYCSKDIPSPAKVGGNNSGYGYLWENPATQTNYCNTICGIEASKNIMYSFTGKNPPSPSYGECIVVDTSSNHFYACCSEIVCRTTINGCTDENNKLGDLYFCPGGYHDLPNKNCKVKVSNAMYDAPGTNEVDIGYSQFCCSR